MKKANEYNYGDGKTKKIIARIEQDCLKVCCSGKCCDYKIRKTGDSFCNNCKINREFIRVVGLTIIEFI